MLTVEINRVGATMSTDTAARLVELEWDSPNARVRDMILTDTGAGCGRVGPS